MTRYPFDALERQVVLGLDVELRAGHPVGATTARIGEALGVSGRTVLRYRHSGLSEEQADRCAVAVGLLPYEVWPEYIDLKDAATRTGSRSKTGDPRRGCCAHCWTFYKPQRRNQRFCRPLCYRRWWSAEMSRRRPDYKATWRAENVDAVRRYRAAYYQLHGGYERERQRLYRARQRASVVGPLIHDLPMQDEEAA